MHIEWWEENCPDIWSKRVQYILREGSSKNGILCDFNDSTEALNGQGWLKTSQNLLKKNL